MKVRHQKGYVFRSGRGIHTAFHIRYYQTELVNGVEKRVQRSSFLCMKDDKRGLKSEGAKPTQDLAAKFMQKINEQSGAVVAHDDMKVVDFFDKEYLPMYEKKNKPDSVRTMREVFETALRNHFGDITLRAYKRSMGRKYLYGLQADLSHDRLVKIKKVAQAIFTAAIDSDKFPEDAEINPWTLVEVKDEWGHKSGETQKYTLEEAENILNVLVDRADCQLAFALAAFNGLRHGEIRGLQWGDIDGTWIHIRRSVDSFGNIGTPKTETSVRDIPLLPSVAFYLELWRRKYKGTGLWVLSETPEPVFLGNMARRVIRPILKKAAGDALAKGDKHLAETLKWKAWHSGRRGASAFSIAQAGVKYAQMLLGHKHADVTLQSYDAPLPPDEFLDGMRRGTFRIRNAQATTSSSGANRSR
jgi:integrase